MIADRNRFDSIGQEETGQASSGTRSARQICAGNLPGLRPIVCALAVFLALVVHGWPGIITAEATSPQSSASARRMAPGNPAAAGCPRTVIIRPGETLAAIAQRCSIAITALKQANYLRSERLVVGQKLTIPATRRASQPRVRVAPTPAIHQRPAP